MPDELKVYGSIAVKSITKLLIYVCTEVRPIAGNF